MKQVPLQGAGECLSATIDWVVDASGGSLGFWCDMWCVEDTGWKVRTIKDGPVAVVEPRAAILIRVGGVERCLNFGVELEMLAYLFGKRTMRFYAPAFSHGEFLDVVAGAQVIIWTAVSVHGCVFRGGV